MGMEDALGRKTVMAQNINDPFTMVQDKKVESTVAIGSFIAAVGLAFTSLCISHDHDIAAGVLMMCAQFLMLTASIFGLDYKISKYIHVHEKEHHA